MTGGYGRIYCRRKAGGEPFECNGEPLGFDLLSFWQWSASDVVSNTLRGILAEYLVARAMGLGETDVREDWAAFDVLSPEGIKVEVKSAAFLQSWAQSRLSIIQFNYRKTRSWDADTNVQSTEAMGHADVYVFALLRNTEQESLNPLDVDQWRFYVVPTHVLNARTRSQQSITLNSLEALVNSVAYDGLRAAVVVAAAGENPSAVHG